MLHNIDAPESGRPFRVTHDMHDDDQDLEFFMRMSDDENYIPSDVSSTSSSYSSVSSDSLLKMDEKTRNKRKGKRRPSLVARRFSETKNLFSSF